MLRFTGGNTAVISCSGQQRGVSSFHISSGSNHRPLPLGPDDDKTQPVSIEI
jgi:hypothetical protein